MLSRFRRRAPPWQPRACARLLRAQERKPDATQQQADARSAFRISLLPRLLDQRRGRRAGGRGGGAERPRGSIGGDKAVWDLPGGVSAARKSRTSNKFFTSTGVDPLSNLI